MAEPSRRAVWSGENEAAETNDVEPDATGGANTPVRVRSDTTAALPGASRSESILAALKDACIRTDFDFFLTYRPLVSRVHQ